MNGFKTFKNVLTDSKHHENSKEHLHCYKSWKTFNQSESIDAALSKVRAEELSRHNEEVTRNRKTLKVLTNAVLYLAKQQLAFRGKDESSESKNRGNYIELLEYFAKLDSVFAQHLHGSGQFVGTSSDIQNDLIKAIDDVLDDVITTEVNTAPFLSIQVDEATDIATQGQLSVILRYVLKGKIIERFLGFYNVSEDKSASAIAKIVKEILCTEKFNGAKD